MIDTKLKEELKQYLEQHYIKPDFEDLQAAEDQDDYLCYEEELTIDEYVKKTIKKF